MGKSKNKYLLTRAISFAMWSFTWSPLLFALIKSILAASNMTLPSANQSNQYKSNSIQSSNNALSKPFLTMKDIYDPTVINLVSRAFHRQKLLLPKVINQNIAEYASPYDDTINEFHDRIMNKLRDTTGRQQIFLNPYSSDFISNLLRLIKNNQKEIPHDAPFWYDLERFLFKYALSKRKEFANNDNLFNESVENVQDIMIIINEKAPLKQYNDNLEFMTNFDFSIFNHSIEYEIFDHSKLLEIFVNDIIDDEGNLKMTIDQIETIYCNGNFNNNPLLKLMLIYFAFGNLAMEQMEEKGWIIDLEFRKLSNGFAVALSHIYLKQEKVKRENKVDRIERLWESYLSQSTIKFFIDNKLKFRITSSIDFVDLLDRIEYIGGLPKGVSISEIVKFGFKGGVYKWDIDKSKEALMERMKEGYISQEKYNKYIKLVK